MVGLSTTTGDEIQRLQERVQEQDAQFQLLQKEALEAQPPPHCFYNCSFSGNIGIEPDGTVNLKQAKKPRNSLKKLYFRRKKII